MSDTNAEQNEPLYTVRACRGHWHVEHGEFDIGGAFASQEDADAEAARLNAGGAEWGDEEIDIPTLPGRPIASAPIVPASQLHAATVRITELESLLAEQDADREVMRETIANMFAAITSGHRASIGSIGNTYCPQISVASVERWRAALITTPPAPASDGERTP